MAEAAVYRELTAIFRDVFARDDLTLVPGLNASDVPGWDSFMQISIVIAVEERYGFKFSTRELDGLGNLGDLVRIVLARRTRR